MEKLDQQLEAALSFAQYQTTLNNQRRQLAEQFESDTLMAHNGGLFKITPELLAGIDPQQTWLLDVNNTPIQIQDLVAFVTEARSIYNAAISRYGEYYQLLRQQRSVRMLTDL